MSLNIRSLPASPRIWLLLAALAPNVQAATLTVNSLNDPGIGVCDGSECTLREAISAASSGDTINL